MAVAATPQGGYVGQRPPAVAPQPHGAWAQPGVPAPAWQPGMGQAHPFPHYPQPINLRTVDWRRCNYAQAKALADAQGHIPTRDMAGWWSGPCWGRTYMADCGDCLCGFWFGCFCIPWPCFMACRQGEANEFTHDSFRQLVIAHRDLMLSYNTCCMENGPEWTCTRVEDGFGC